MAVGIVIRPFIADIGGVEERLEVGFRIAEDELERWGRSVNTLVNTHFLALAEEVAPEEASIETLIAELKVRGADVAAHTEGLIAHLQQYLEGGKPKRKPPAKRKPAARKKTTTPQSKTKTV